jgi:hypothetical protein
MDYGYDLNLTPEQLKKIQELRLVFQKDILELNSEWDTVSIEVDTMMMKGEDQEKIDEKIKALDALDAELEKKFMAHQEQIRNVLTEEQRVIFDRTGGLGLGFGGGFGMGYGRGYGRGFGMGYGRGYGRGFGMGYGRGYGRGWGRGYAGDFNRGYGRGINRGYARGYAWSSDRFYSRGATAYGRNTGRFWSRGQGRGYRCPFYRFGRGWFPSRRFW